MSFHRTVHSALKALKNNEENHNSTVQVGNSVSLLSPSSQSAEHCCKPSPTRSEEGSRVKHSLRTLTRLTGGAAMNRTDSADSSRWFRPFFASPPQLQQRSGASPTHSLSRRDGKISGETIEHLAVIRDHLYQMDKVKYDDARAALSYQQLQNK